MNYNNGQMKNVNKCDVLSFPEEFRNLLQKFK